MDFELGKKVKTIKMRKHSEMKKDIREMEIGILVVNIVISEWCRFMYQLNKLRTTILMASYLT